MIKATLITAAATNVALLANGECANACNGHGRCTSYDMCVCQRNWQANDCSERVCQYGLAHVDTPKGDLDHSGSISDADEIVVENNFKYPYGTTEKFPRMQSSDLTDLPNSAHYYMECSNKGTCNRESGECECLPGYDGAACQRASCPGFPDSCSGHGTCETIRQLAIGDSSNVYELWDRDVTMGCKCDAGFFGPDCSQRQCKYAVDQLYMDDTSTVKYSTWNFAVLHDYMYGSSEGSGDWDFHNGMYDKGTGHWAIRFFDMHGEDWVTGPIAANAPCSEVVAALNALPNNVIPGMDVNQCTQLQRSTGTAQNAWTNGIAVNEASVPYNSAARGITFQSLQQTSTGSKLLAGSVYQIKFYQNPGKLKQPEIELKLDGERNSLAAGPLDGPYTVETFVFTDGQQGESIDYFGDHCDDVTVQIGMTSADDHFYLGGLTTVETQLLKACLGGADDDVASNKEIYDWDYGSIDYPHLVKLVLSQTAQTDGGYYVALYWDGTVFKLLHAFYPLDVSFATGVEDEEYEVYTTKGVLARTSKYTEASVAVGSNLLVTTNVTADTEEGVQYTQFTGDISCENYADNMGYVSYCVNKTDIIIPLHWGPNDDDYKQQFINMYTVDKIGQVERTVAFGDARRLSATDVEINQGTNQITMDMSSNFYHAAMEQDALDAARSESNLYVYKFFPDAASNYEYVAQCANRGICNTEEGLCECFGGYTGDACQIQASLSV